MKIAQIAPLYESVPPKLYGGTERVVHQLTEELVRRGHDVTLYASGDSVTSARLVPVCESSLRLQKSVVDHVAYHVLMAERVYQEARRYDIIHSHIDYFPFSMFRRLDAPCLTTLHGRLDLPDLVPVYLEFDDIPLVAISDAQRKPLPWANWLKTIHHGLAKNQFTFREQPGEYLAFLGRVSEEKRIVDAIEIARRAGVPLRIAAKVDRADRDYFENEVKRLLDQPLIEYVGELEEERKNEFLGNARALLFPIDWPEPFGLVMIEALACGTPVIARDRGSVAEILEDGVTGIIIGSIEDGVRAVENIGSLSRKNCREAFERRFTAQRMASDYLKVYGELLAKGRQRKLRGDERYVGDYSS